MVRVGLVIGAGDGRLFDAGGGGGGGGEVAFQRRYARSEEWFARSVASCQWPIDSISASNVVDLDMWLCILTNVVNGLGDDGVGESRVNVTDSAICRASRPTTRHRS